MKDAVYNFINMVDDQIMKMMKWWNNEKIFYPKIPYND